ncbi:probable ATP-dependent RNA helicase spindle-E [Orussus abietinus]|uniref:probable ATP-dependent RNA helicase spindle-E n=1 Tax=Orussus abietinus TaxID=222816 RepID=UPI0006267C26|nr:probable ATP-dependent RNA helicase spindle-E [Orussus abietinus]
MDPMLLFQSEVPVKRLMLLPSTSRRYVPLDMSALKSELNNERRKEKGTDYVTEYVKEEEERLLESANTIRAAVGDNSYHFDAVSTGTLPTLAEINCEELTKIYKTYNFEYRPKINLTITSMKDKIVSMIETNSVVIIQGPTGCGKTTQVPQFVLNSCFKKRQHCNIIVCQPRRIAAISIAKRVSEERKWPIGSLVGYKVGMVNNTSHDTRLTFCTTGVLLRKLINTKHMLDFTHVILDEVHERNQEMDFLLLVVRKLLRTNSRTVKVILMSATFNVGKFSKYFSSPLKNKLSPAPIIDIEKKSYFNVSTYYLCQMAQLGPLPEVRAEEPKVSERMMNFCVNLIIVLDEIDMQTEDEVKKEDGSFLRHVILIFLPGIYEIEEMYNILTSSKNEVAKWDVIVLHSSITNEEQQRIFEKPPTGFRRIILSTNIAESSITVPDVKYVIDFCLTKQLVTDPKTNFQSLELVWASKANCVQRAGRTGRVMDGRVYRLIPKSFFESVLQEEASPEILRAPLENTVLNTKLLDMGDPKSILALSLDPPDLSNLERTILSLKEAGALTEKPGEFKELDGQLTDLGKVMAHLPLDIHVSKLIILGHVFSVLRDTIIIGASMSVKSMFSTPFQNKLQAYNAKLVWADRSCSDCIAFMNAFTVWAHEKARGRLHTNALEKSWASRHFIQVKVLREVNALVQEITSRLKSLGICETVGVNKVVWDEVQKPFVLKIVIAGAFYPHYFVRSTQGGQLDEQSGLKLLGGLDPAKTVYMTGWPLNHPGVVYAKRIQDYFKDCLTSPMGKISVSFDGSSRVYVQFKKGESSSRVKTGQSGEIPGKVSLEVYKALKLRQSNMPLTVPIMGDKEAQDRMTQLKLKPYANNYFFVQNGFEDDAPAERVLRPVLPTLDVSCIPLVIVDFESVSHFWAHIKDDTIVTLTNMDRALNEIDCLAEFDYPPEIGSFVIAPRRKHTTDKPLFSRGIVQNYIMQGPQNRLAQVFFIDYGYTENVSTFNLRHLLTQREIAKIPAQALECVLAGIRPSISRNLSDQWSVAAWNTLQHAIAGHRVSLFGEVYSVVNGVIAVTLYSLYPEGEKKNLNELLIEKGHAERKEEDFMSRQNHELREQQADMTQEQRRKYEELQYDQTCISDKYADPPERESCRSEVTLKGPYSPLEIRLLHLTSAGRTKRINIEWNSVNSILLDNNPEDSHEQLLVAGSVGQSSNGTNLMLRNTTLMPNVPGLTAIISLVFAPKIELRRNSMGTDYVGALCGLGSHPVTKTSIFPEHDMTVAFDVEITIDDLQDINRLRHWMNMGIHTNSDIENKCEDLEEIAICQNKIKGVLLRLLERRRESRKYDLGPNFDRWNRYDESLFLPPGRIDASSSAIFKLHYALELEEANPELEAMTEHARELRVLASQSIRGTPATEVHCKMCNQSIFGVLKLLSHLYSKEHREREKILNIHLEEE